jgi:hypothetical protein
LGIRRATTLFGIGVGGAGMATVTAYTNLQTAALVQAAVIIAVLALVTAWQERPGERRFPWSPGSAQGIVAMTSFGMLITLLTELKRALSNRTTATLVFVAGTYALAEGLYDPLTVEFFVQELGWTADAWHGPEYPHVLLLPAFKGTLAFATVSLFSLYMKVSWTRDAATQFTVYMAMGNVGYAIGAKLNAWLPQVGFTPTLTDFYLVAGFLPIVPLLLLIGLDPDGVVTRKLTEQRRAAPALTGAT